MNDDDTLDSSSRRRVLGGLAAAGAGPWLSSARAAGLPSPQDSGIDHIVVVMMENRSFDHMLGWLPGADGRQQGLSFVDGAGVSQPSFALSSDPAYGYQGCGWADPQHGYDAGRDDYAGGAMSGFLLRQPVGDLFPIGYLQRADVPFYSACADQWTVCDHYHTGMLGPTFPNRIYMHAGQTDRKGNTLKTCRLPTVWDSLLEHEISCRYYYADLPIIALWGRKYFKASPIAHPIRQFVQDFSGNAGTPPSVSYLDPYMLGEGKVGTSWDDHPAADIRNGQAFLNYVYTVLKSSPAWPRTLLVINYDEWGGFFDHVAPPVAPVTPAEYAATGNDGRLGIRVPCVAIGPRARRGHVASEGYDCNSILNMICWRFGLPALGARAGSANLAQVLDFDNPPDTRAPDLDVPAGPFMLVPPFTPPRPGARGAFGGRCGLAPSADAAQRAHDHQRELLALQALARQAGAEV